MVPASSDSELIEVRRSDVHGLGVFALQPISKGTRIVEYLGERVSHNEADRRYETKDANDSHTFLFIVDSKTVIDAGVEGNDARFFNHSCDPNCESVVEKRRVYIEAIRDVQPGDELTYDYQIQREDDDPENIDEVFACRCGFPQCRGTMLWPTERKPRRKAAAKKKGKARAKTQARSKTKAKTRVSKGGVAAKSAKTGRPGTREPAGRKSAAGKRPAGRRSTSRARGKRSGRRG